MSHITPSFIIFSDLDGTLLDHETYEWAEAEEALDLCRNHNVPVVLVSSKTRAEMEVISGQLRIEAPFVTENGGGIFFPQTLFPDPPFGTVFAEIDNYWQWSLGVPYQELVEVLKDLKKIPGLTIRGFSDMTVEEIAALTGLNRQEALLASRREFDEPFILPEQGNEALRVLKPEIKKKGLLLSTGGRFHHLHGKSDKGEAVALLIDWYRKTCANIITVALGDSPNDFSMLERVKYPVLVRSLQPVPFSWLDKIKRVRVTTKMGPGGWNEAVLDILKENLGGGTTGNV